MKSFAEVEQPCGAPSQAGRGMVQVVPYRIGPRSTVAEPRAGGVSDLRGPDEVAR